MGHLRGELIPYWASALAMLAAVSGCVSNPADSCLYHSDCQRDGKKGVCAANGFCERECVDDSDCPCGSFCASGCGLCITDDLAGSATCFAQDRGLSSTEIITGACRGAKAPARNADPDASLVCRAGLLEAAMCEADAGAPPVEDDDAGSEVSR